MEDTLRYKFDKDLLLNYDHENPPRHGSCCYAEFVEARDYDKLREQNRVLREAAQQAMDLIHEDIVQGDKAGRRLKAEAILWNALTATSQPGGTHEL